ncbi:MAG: HAD family phosphatase [Erysipelotrichaceae bacterium]|nr:HAD family phosphatase [Erysipelotrichaceae bacterium]
MIRNFIFDMGGVLIRFDPELFTDRLNISDPKDKEILLKEIFYSYRWKEMDLGLYDEKEMYQKIIANIPVHLHEAVERLLFHWYEPLIPVEGIDELVFTLKEKGYQIYLLSNAPISQKLYWSDIHCSSCFDGVVVSSFEKCIKPDPKIYRILLDRYDLKAEECFFIDDMPANTDAAERLGIKAYLFDDTDHLKDYLKKEGIL